MDYKPSPPRTPWLSNAYNIDAYNPPINRPPPDPRFSAWSYEFNPETFAPFMMPENMADEKTGGEAASRNGSSASSITRRDENETINEGEQKFGQDVTAKDATPEKRSNGKVALIMFALALACFMAALDISIVTTALPTISTYFQSETVYTWVGSSYLLGTAATTIIWGKLSDIFGRKPVLLTATVIFFIGSLLCALAVNVTMLLFGRVIQGVASAGLNNLVNICIGDLFSPRERGAFMAAVSIVWALALSLGPIIGGAFTEGVTWRWCFWINLPLDGIAFFIILFFLDIKTPKTPFWDGIKAIDWVGAVLSLGSILMFLFGISFGGDRNPWNSPTVICLIVFGVVGWVLFLLYEAYVAKYPLLPTTVFKKAAPLALLGICFFQSCVYLAVTYYLPLYFQVILDATPLLSGVYLLPIALPLSIAAIAGGFYMRKTGNYQHPIWAGLVVMTIGVGLLIDLGPNANWALIILSQIVLGAGTGPIFQAPLIALQSLVPQRYVAAATSTFSFVRMLAGSIGIVIGQVIFSNQAGKQQARLAQAVGPDLAARLAGGSAGANTRAIQALPADERQVVHEVLASALKDDWILFTAFAAAALVVMLFIGKKSLSADHEETKLGLEAEKEAREERLAAEKAKREAKASGNVESKV